MMAFSGVRNSWLMLARNFDLRGVGLIGLRAGVVERLLLQFARGDVAHHRDHLGFAVFAPGAIEPPAPHLHPDELRHDIRRAWRR